MKEGQFVTGVDIGGSHITAALIDISERKIVSSTLARLSINAGGGVAEIMDTWSKCIRQSEHDVNIEQVCLAMPGPFDYVKGISGIQGQAKYEKLFGLNVKELLGEALQLPPSSIYMDNDAACFLHGEVFAGNARSYHDEKVIGITLGTGLGSAVYNKGRAFSADLWDLPFKDRIAEDFLSTRWFLKRFEELTGQRVNGVKDIAIQAGQQENAQAVFNEFGKNLSEFLLEFIRRESPSAIVIGGNISKAYDLFKGVLEPAIDGHDRSVKIHLSSLGEEASLLGAVGSWHAYTKAGDLANW
ncbi:ROK family protein [Terrimonas sp. NA20]|uniref:ROK family protein n=1 Tax=Terrimonas ginsenosidimutans TaxID=2908004 RepID=A0ABS9KWL5_9BACT|nr:ROK family protein [Terrimonas ginsenosidimutans]MCG2616710.1 ROK family protein [Terrimonas ginsenosidimutans]